MICEKCNKEIAEGNFLHLPAHKQTPQGIVASYVVAIVCDDCTKNINQHIIGKAKIVEAEIETNQTEEKKP